MQNEFDALTQGVGIGGVRSKYAIRILLCYILSKVQSNISRSAFVEICQSSNLVNFFEINPALDSLVENGLVNLIPSEQDDYFEITNDGMRIAEKLQYEIPTQTREEALSVAFKIVSKERLKGSVNYKIEKNKDYFYVIFTVVDNNEIMMQTKLFAVDYLQAQLIGEKFLCNPEKLYSGIIDALS